MDRSVRAPRYQVLSLSFNFSCFSPFQHHFISAPYIQVHFVDSLNVSCCSPAYHLKIVAILIYRSTGGKPHSRERWQFSSSANHSF
jgi:hypothetical protein